MSLIWIPYHPYHGFNVNSRAPYVWFNEEYQVFPIMCLMWSGPTRSFMSWVWWGVGLLGLHYHKFNVKYQVLSITCPIWSTRSLPAPTPYPESLNFSLPDVYIILEHGSAVQFLCTFWLQHWLLRGMQLLLCCAITMHYMTPRHFGLFVIWLMSPAGEYVLIRND